MLKYQNKVCPSQNTWSENEMGKYCRLWCEIVSSQYNYSEFYRCMTKIIENLIAQKKMLSK